MSQALDYNSFNTNTNKNITKNINKITCDCETNGLYNKKVKRYSLCDSCSEKIFMMNFNKFTQI